MSSYAKVVVLVEGPTEQRFAKNWRFKKTTTGIAIAEKIGVDKMREKCPLFNRWLEQLESLP